MEEVTRIPSRKRGSPPVAGRPDSECRIGTAGRPAGSGVAAAGGDPPESGAAAASPGTSADSPSPGTSGDPPQPHLPVRTPYHRRPLKMDALVMRIAEGLLSRSGLEAAAGSTPTTSSAASTTPPGRRDEAEGLKTKISTALGGLLNRALEKKLAQGTNWQPPSLRQRPVTAPPPLDRSGKLYDNTLVQHLMTKPLLRMGIGSSLDPPHPFQCEVCGSRFPLLTTLNRHRPHCAWLNGIAGSANTAGDAGRDGTTDSSELPAVLAHCKAEHGSASQELSLVRGSGAAGEAARVPPDASRALIQRVADALNELDGKTDPGLPVVPSDLPSQPLQEIETIYVKEEKFELEVPEEDDARDPLQVDEEKPNCELEETIIGTKLERSPAECDNCTDDSGTPATRESQEAGTTVSPCCTAEPEETRGKERIPRMPTHCWEKASAQLRLLENCGVADCDDSLLKCDACRMMFVGTSALKAHLYLHAWEHSHRCGVCSKTGEQSYRCDVCGKTFSRKDYLKGHLVVHTDERPHSCHLCDKKFKSRDPLRVHLLHLHSTQRPYRCSVCGKAFKMKSYLKIHLQLHSQERPHSCGICSKKFKHKDALRKHSVVHTR